MFLGAGGVAERSRQRAEVMVDCCVVGGAPGNHDVGARPGAESLVHPGPLGGAAGYREDNRRRGQAFRAGRFGDVEDTKINAVQLRKSVIGSEFRAW
jgi:hypothetical protein